VTSLRLPAKRVKFLFQRLIAFETAHGTEETLNAARQRARDYAQSSDSAKTS